MSNYSTESSSRAVRDILVALGLEEEALAAAENAGIAETLSSRPSSIDDIFGHVLHIAENYGVTARAEVLVEELKERTEIIRHKLKFVEDRPSVVCITGLSPLETNGGIIAELISIAGGKPVGRQGGLSYDVLESLEPEVILIAVPGNTVEMTVREINFLFGLDGWNELPAVKNNRVYILDGKKYIHLLSPAIIDSLEMLAEIIQPKQFIFGFEGEAWVKFGV